MNMSTFDINDIRSYIFLVPKGKERTFVDSILDLSPTDERIKIICSKPNGSFRIYFLYLPESNFDNVEKKLNELQNDFLRNL